MAGLTVALAQAQLDLYLEAERKVLSNQSYSLLGRTLTRANLAEIQDGIDLWDRRIKDLAAKESGRGRTRIVSPSW